jgi:transcriptional regulator with XRE-family HTH domain
VTLIQETRPVVRLRAGTLHRVCKDLDCSRDELARRLGISSASAYKIDVGRANPSNAFIARLVLFTGRRFDDLFEVTRSAA